MKHARGYMRKKIFTRNVKGKGPLLRPRHGCEGPLKAELTGKIIKLRTGLKLLMIIFGRRFLWSMLMNI
jgi:hypothetical protein